MLYPWDDKYHKGSDLIFAAQSLCMPRPHELLACIDIIFFCGIYHEYSFSTFYYEFCFIVSLMMMQMIVAEL